MENIENILGLLEIRVKKGYNLAVRDTHIHSCDHVIITMGEQACFFVLLIQFHPLIFIYAMYINLYFINIFSVAVFFYPFVFK